MHLNCIIGCNDIIKCCLGVQILFKAIVSISKLLQTRVSRVRLMNFVSTLFIDILITKCN